MKLSHDELLKTKILQDPRNQALLEEAQRSIGSPPNLGAVGDSLPQQNEVRALGAKPPKYKSRKSRLAVCVTIIRFGAQSFDEDNFQAGAKPLRDSIATSLGVDDADPRVLWQYRQVTRSGQRGTIVKIDLL